MKIKAKFKGSNSLGYENGKNYHLFFSTAIRENQIFIKDIANIASPCAYGSLKSFLNNWQVF